MVKDGDVYFIDYQGGRRGPSAYDLASFLWQAKAGFSHELRERLIEVYADEARRYDDVDAEIDPQAHFDGKFVIVRKGKKHYYLARVK